MPRSQIILKNIQIKSQRKLELLCACIEEIEIETFIKSGWITFENPFVCPDIDLDKVNKTPTEILVVGLLKKIKGIDAENKRKIREAG